MSTTFPDDLKHMQSLEEGFLQYPNQTIVIISSTNQAHVQKQIIFLLSQEMKSHGVWQHLKRQ